MWAGDCNFLLSLSRVLVLQIYSSKVFREVNLDVEPTDNENCQDGLPVRGQQAAGEDVGQATHFVSPSVLDGFLPHLAEERPH